MKINFTYNNKDYTICTIKEFADILAEKAYKEETSVKTKFIADFTIIDIENNDAIDINNIGNYVEKATGWCGVKELGEIGFNDTAKQFVFDYYGGNQMIMDTFPDEYMKEDCADEIISSLCYTLDIDKININWCVLVQWTQDERLKKDEEEATRAIQQYEVVEVCPECGAENIMAWDVEKDGYVAYCPHCGSKMMLCDECIHSDNAPICDWNPHNGCCREHEKCKKNSKSSK